MSQEKTKLSAPLLILAPIILCVVVSIMLHNSLVTKEEAVRGSWSQVESNYQRRSDLIPTLVQTVKQFAEHEKSVLNEVTEKRTHDNEINAAIEGLLESRENVAKLSPKHKEKIDDDTYMKALALAQQKVGKQMSHLFGLVENYPQLRSSDNFLALQDQLESTENRINIARMNFNEHVASFNAAIRKIPGNLIANISGLQPKAYFKADEGAEKATKVTF